MFKIKRKTDGKIWFAKYIDDQMVFISPDDGRVPSGQRISISTFKELFDIIY